MIDYLNNNLEILKKVSLKQIAALIEIILQSTLSSEQYILRRYHERAKYFDETATFLLRIGILEKGDDSYHLSKSFQERIGEQMLAPSLPAVLIDALFHAKRNPYKGVFNDYLSGYQAIDGQIGQKHTGQDIYSSHSSIRNLLMELGVVHYDRDTSRYLLSPDHFDLYLATRSKNHQVSPDALKGHMNAKESLGYAAEIAVISYEKKRLGSTFAPLIDHVSTRNVNAGFDIKSFSILESGNKVPRYIEVKAVSSVSYKFYWTTNEIDTSRMLSEYYYLYLLPLRHKGAFNVRKLIIIRDPYKHVYNDRVSWFIEENVLSCSLISPLATHNTE